MIIGITGASGRLGRLIVNNLLKKVAPEQLVLLVRDPSKVEDFAARGVAVRVADYDQPETLAAAFKGIDRLLLISSSAVGRRVTQHSNAIDAAKLANVGLLFYTSFLHADTSTLNVADEHRYTEEVLATSGVPNVRIRNGWYTENYAGIMKDAVAKGELVNCVGDGRISGAARTDYAEAAAAIVLNESSPGTVYNLAGDESFTFADLAAELSRQSGRPITYRNLNEQDYVAELIAEGSSEAAAKLAGSRGTAKSNGALFYEGREMSRLIGRPTTPLGVSVGDALKT